MKTETEPKQTAMQRLIEKIINSVETEIWVVNNPTGYDERDVARAREVYYIASRCIVFAESLLPEERKEIEEAYMDGKVIKHMRTKVDIESATEYYQTKFKQ